jgi:hypothetical protein
MENSHFGWTDLRGAGQFCPRAPRELRRGKVPERAVRPHLVVVLPPGFDDLAGLIQTDKPMLVQTLVAELAVEALHVGVLHRLARPDEVQLHTAPIGPLIQCLTGELWPVVDHDHLRQAALLTEGLELAHHAPAR